ncbi:MFS transporter [Dethiosulfatarculus sandiegensis]|nr:MFS transporter [Dethiosulfatarculus sandiegensis]
MRFSFFIDKINNTSWQRTLYVMFFARMIAMIGFSSIFPFLPLYVKSLGSATSLGVDLCVGLVYSGQAFSMMIASPIWGALSDRWGRKIMVERAMFGGVVIMSLMAFVSSAEELVFLRMIQGMITGIMGSTNALVAACVPRGRMGYAMGMMTVGVGLGLGLGPVIGGVVADAFGYDAAFYVTAILLLLAGFITLWGVEEEFEPVVNKGDKKVSFIASWRRILSLPGVMLIYSLRFINQMSRILFIPILPLFALTLLEDPEGVNSFTGVVIGLSSLATAFFSVYLGQVGDRGSHRKILIVCLALAGVFFVSHGFAQNAWQLLVLQVFYGVALGGSVTGISALLAHLTKHGDEGAVYGLDSSVNSGARMLGPLLGVGISAALGVRTVFFLAGSLYIVACILALWKLPKETVEN